MNMHYYYSIYLAIICALVFQHIDYSNCKEEKPYRMQKLNLVWEKANKKLAKEKLKLLQTDLKYQDKEELALKKLKAENLDKDGLKEASVRASFKAILIKYGLIEDFEILQEAVKDARDEFMSSANMKYEFRDKKLNKLWLKAEQQGFTEDQLNILKQEFHHHQDKIDQYYQVMEKISDGSWHKDDPSNTIKNVLEAEEGTKKWKNQGSPHQELKKQHSELKKGYDYLAVKINPSLGNIEFDEPQVSGLWEMAKKVNFTEVELESLKAELYHFQHRVKKYKHLSDLQLSEHEETNLIDAELKKRRKKLEAYEYKVEKHRVELAERILARHTEL